MGKKSLSATDRRSLEKIKAYVSANSFLTEEIKKLGVIGIQVSEVKDELENHVPNDKRVMHDDGIIFIKVLKSYNPLKPRFRLEKIEQICAITITKGKGCIRHYWDNDQYSNENHKIAHFVHNNLISSLDPDDLTCGFFEEPGAIKFYSILNELDNNKFNGPYNEMKLRIKGDAILPPDPEPNIGAEGKQAVDIHERQLTPQEIEGEENYEEYVKLEYGS